MKNTWTQINAASMPPTTPKTPRAKSLLQGANPTPLAITHTSSGRARTISREDTLTSLPHQPLGLRFKRKERCWEERNTWLISFFFPSTTSQKESPSFQQHIPENLASSLTPLFFLGLKSPTLYLFQTLCKFLQIPHPSTLLLQLP